MSKASKIINIFIFVFAIVVVVFGVFLFQKREQITQSRKRIAEAVEKVTQQIDRNAVVRSDELTIDKKTDDVDAAMRKLEESVDKIVKQRNAIAENLAEVTGKVLEDEFLDVGEDPFALEDDSIIGYKKTNDTLEAIQARIAKRMEYFSERNAKISEFMSKDGANLRMSAREYAYDPSNKTLGDSLDNLLKKTNDTVERMDAFRGHIVTVSGKISPDSNPPDLNSQEYKRLLSEDMTSVEFYVKDYLETKKQNEELRERVVRAEARLGEADEDASTYRRVAEEAERKRSELEKEIVRLQQIIDPTGFGDKENGGVVNYAVLKDLVGKVVYVNEEHGFITVDIGSESEVVRTTGEHIRASVPEGALLTVVTSLNPDDAKFICKAQVIRLRSKACVATILASAGGNFTAPSVGDIVYFSQADIATMKAANEEAMRRKAEERAAAEREQALQDFNDIMTGEDEMDEGGIELDDDFLNEEDNADESFGDDADDADDGFDFDEE